MPSPSNRRHAWSWLPVACSCCGLLLVGLAVRFVTAQEKPPASPPTATAPPAASRPVAAPEFLPRLSPNELKILNTFDAPTEVAFVDNPLEDALRYLKDLHNIEIWIDKEAMSADGIATDTQVSLQLSGITLQSALRLLLEPLALTCVIDAEVLKITTQKAADKTLITRTYPAGDLFDSPQEAVELVDVIMSGLGLGPEAKGAMPHNMFVPQFGTASASIKTLTVERNAPQEEKSGAAPKKGAGTIAVSFKARALVARQPHAVHDEILQLLRDLREAKTFAPVGPVHAVGGFAHPYSAPTYGPTPGALTPTSPTPIDEFSPGLVPPRDRLPEPRGDDIVPTKPKPVR